MKLKAKDINLDTNFSHYSERDRLTCEQLQAKARELLTSDRRRPSRGLRMHYENRHPDVLLNAAAMALGNAPYDAVYACESCGRLYHVDYADSSDPKHDYCGATCQPERSHRKYD